MMIRVLVAEPASQRKCLLFNMANRDAMAFEYRARGVNSNLERYFLPARFDIAVGELDGHDCKCRPVGGV